MTKNEYQRRRRESLAARGVCIGCGREPARPGRRYCHACTKRAYKARRKRMREPQGYHGPKPDYVAAPLRAGRLELLAARAKAGLPLFDE